MRRLLKGGLVLLFVLLIALGGIIIHTVVQSRHYGELVNYVGIVRGATQRLVKLELNNKPDDSIVEYLDGILQELKTGKGGYGLPLPDDGTSCWFSAKTISSRPMIRFLPRWSILPVRSTTCWSPVSSCWAICC